MAKWVPLIWGAFLDFQRHGEHLSRIEGEVLVALIGSSRARARAIAESNGLIRMGKDGGLARNREREELEAN